MTASWTNWSGWVKSWPRAILAPDSEETLAATIASAVAPVRVAGRGHSFTPLVASEGTILTLQNIAGVIDHNPDEMTARLKAGTNLRDIGPELYERGLALLNQGDIDRQTIAGAIGTGTHGTGGALGSLSAGVKGFRLVSASGDVLTCAPDENKDVFEAGRVSIGALGVMSEITMQCREPYALAESGGRVPIEEALSQAPSLRDKHRHFEFFWFPYAREALIKILDEVPGTAEPRRRRPDGEDSRDDQIFRMACNIAMVAPFLRGPLQKFLTSGSGSRYSSGSLMAPGRKHWSHDAFPSDRNVRFNEMEYAVPAERGPDCVREVGAYFRSCGMNCLFPIEFRYVAGDDAWISPFYQRDSVTISVHQYHRQPYAELFAGLEKIFRRHEGRPHWGKLHTLTHADFATIYPRWEDFRALRRRLDPQGKFLNEHLRGIFGEA